MKQLPIYKVVITTAQGSKLGRTFIGRPNREEVLAAIRQARQARLTQNLTDAEYQLVMDRYDDFALLVDDYWLANKELQKCHYADTFVGTIKTYVDDGVAFLTTEGATNATLEEDE
jgi:hypothetical protein